MKSVLLLEVLQRPRKAEPKKPKLLTLEETLIALLLCVCLGVVVVWVVLFVMAWLKVGN